MKQQIRALLLAGVSYREIEKRIGCSRSTVAYHAKSLGVAPGFREYCWADVQQYYDQGHSLRACMEKFGFSSCAWYTACRSGQIVPRPKRLIPLDELLVDGRKTARPHLKMRLFQAGLLENKCAECGLTEWKGRSLPLELHHQNGKNDDNRLENLQMLCPNCHSQTPTYSGRNRGIVKKLNKSK